MRINKQAGAHQSLSIQITVTENIVLYTLTWVHKLTGKKTIKSDRQGLLCDLSQKKKRTRFFMLTRSKIDKHKQVHRARWNRT